MTKRIVKDKSTPPFVQIDIRLINALTNAEFKIYAQIKRRAGEDGECWESLEHMAKETGNSVSTLQRSLKTLKRMGLIAKIRRPGETDVYELTPPEKWHLPSQNDRPNIGQNDQGVRSKRPEGFGQNDRPNIGQNDLLNRSPIEIDPFEIDPLNKDPQKKNEECAAPKLDSSLAPLALLPENGKASSKPKMADADFQVFRQSYNQNRPSAWAECHTLNGTRISALKTLWKTYGDRSLEVFEEALGYLRDDKWHNSKDLTIDYLLRQGRIATYSERAANQMTANPEARKAEIYTSLMSVIGNRENAA